MTEELIPYIASVEFTAPAPGTSGIIRLKNDNPSGDPERDLYFDLPITF